MKQLIESVQASYSLIVEGKQVEPKFKVGEKVGMGSHGSTGLYYPRDTGVVTAVDKQGNHTVTHDNHKEHDSTGSLKPAQSIFNVHGIGQSNNSQISSIDAHNAALDHSKKTIERTEELGSIMRHLQGAVSNHGHFMAPLQKTQVEHFKALLDKHSA